MEIVLTPIELDFARAYTKRHLAIVYERGYQNRAPTSRAQEIRNVAIGAAAEIAVAKDLGVYWKADLEGFRNADLLDRIQVRSSPRNDAGLILWDKDSKDHLYVLVVGMPPNLRIAGMIWGSEGIQPKYWNTVQLKKPTYLIPQSELDPYDRSFVLKEGRIKSAN